MNTLIRATFLGASATLGLLAPAHSHHAPSGWKYPGGCCNAADCFQIDGADVEWAANGWRIKSTQEVIPFERAQFSDDGHWHRCAYDPTKPDSRTRDDIMNRGMKCLYVPAPEN
jgi:hypothetical protein